MILKNTFANDAFEHFEIAACTSLLALCSRPARTARSLLKENLREEQRMPEWIDANVGRSRMTIWRWNRRLSFFTCKGYAKDQSAEGVAVTKATILYS